MKKHLLSIGALALLFSCQPEFNDPVNELDFYHSGTADFSNYVAVGNSLTSGYADNALYLEGQLNSFPSMLAKQFALTGGGEFKQPLVNDNLGGLVAAGELIQQNRLVLEVSAAGQSPVPYKGTPSTDITQHLEGPYNNMGVPGAKSFHLLANGYGDIAQLPAANPYFIRFASSPQTSVIEDAVAQNPSFFSLWIGNNDILSFATSGGTGVDQTGNIDPTTYGDSDITDPNVFASTYDQLLKALTSGGAKGVVANIPDITAIPYFTTVPHNPLDPSNPAFGPQIPMLNTVFGALNQVFAALGMSDRSIVFSADAASAVVVKDESLEDIAAQIAGALGQNPQFPLLLAQFGVPTEAAPTVAQLLGNLYGQARQATADDLLVLTSSNTIGQVNEAAAQGLISMGLSEALAAQFSVEGVTLPLEDQWVLTPDEQALVQTATDSYNSTIKALAQQYELAFVDINALMEQLATEGVPFDGGTITGVFGTGGAFSLDGVHPTQRGYAVIANQFIEAINQTYQADLPILNPGSYPTIFIK